MKRDRLHIQGQPWLSDEAFLSPGYNVLSVGSVQVVVIGLSLGLRIGQLVVAVEKDKT